MRRRVALALATTIVAAVAVTVLFRAGDGAAPPEVQLVTGPSAPLTLPLPPPAAEVAAVVVPDPVAVQAETKASGDSTAVAVGNSSVAVVDTGDTASVVVTNSGTAVANTGGNTGDNVVTGPATAVGNRATVDLRR